jgi:hypothetical protein
MIPAVDNLKSRMIADRPATGYDYLMAGIKMIRDNRHTEASPLIEHAVAQLQEELVTACCCRASIFAEMGKLAEAIAALDEILVACPDHHVARFNRGALKVQALQLDEAIADYAAAANSKELRRQAIFGAGCAHLTAGRLKEGFAGLESRQGTGTSVPAPPDPEWNGEESIDGQTILVLGEMGYGDNINFLRYAPLLRARGARVRVIVPSALVPLANTIEGVEASDGREKVQYDVWVRMMSLAHRFGTDIDTMPPPAQFKLSPAKLSPARLSPVPLDRSKLNVGLCWSGGIKNHYDKFRNIPFGILRALIDPFRLIGMPNVDFYSLQLYIRDADRQAFDEKVDAYGIYDAGSLFLNFLDAARFLSRLDLVITVDTAIAHLAGSLGIETWVMLARFRTYWTWMKDRNDSPWYPKMRLFRQSTDGDWASVVASVKMALEEKCVDSRSFSRPPIMAR